MQVVCIVICCMTLPWDFTGRHNAGIGSVWKILLLQCLKKQQAEAIFQTLSCLQMGADLKMLPETGNTDFGKPVEGFMTGNIDFGKPVEGSMTGNIDFDKPNEGLATGACELCL